MTTPLILMWFRRDLRLDDNAALYHALKAAVRQGGQVIGVFVFDTAILQHLPKADRRVEFIRESLVDLDQQLQSASQGRARLWVLHGESSIEIPRLAQQLQIKSVFTNHDDEPASLARDAQVAQQLRTTGCELHTYKDHVIFERTEVLTQMGKPFTVFTPYKNAWLKKLAGDADGVYLKSYPCLKYLSGLACKHDGLTMPVNTVGMAFKDGPPSLAEIGFVASNLRALKITAGTVGGELLWREFFDRIDRYHEARDFPAIKGVSYLGVHLRFGTVSIRMLARCAYALHLQGNAGASVWLSELIWRDFYHQIMANFPHCTTGAFKREYDGIAWEQGDLANERFAAWCEARTGYPLVDAAMRQLNQTGYMHNRLRMVTASFLTKDLGLDWRWGEAYFAKHLNDFDLAANNGGWQWSASTGCDAQPYFRIFNPISQSERFDPKGNFIRRYVPELDAVALKQLHAPWLVRGLADNYPSPIVDHAIERQRTLERYKTTLRSQD